MPDPQTPQVVAGQVPGSATPAAPTPGTSAFVNSLPPGSSERALAAAELYAGRQNNGSEMAPARPEGVPEKFWDKDTGQVNTALLLASYTALETKMGSGAPAVPAAAVAAPVVPAVPANPNAPLAIPPPAIVIPPGTDPVVAVVTQAGLNADALTAAIVANGDITEADYAAIAKIGIPPELIKSHVAAIRGQVNAAVTANNAKALTAFGGEERAQAVLAWAGANLQPAEVTRLNGKLKGPDFMDAVEVLNGRFAVANPAGLEPRLVQGSSGNSAAVAGYRSTAERTKDMQNPQYRTDPAFRAQVTAKMRAATYDLDR